jgi:CheY-like chemotaxis protein
MSEAALQLVVVAHEEETIRDVAVRVAEGCGYKAIGVPDGAAAEALLMRTPPPAALVVDVGLPGRLGYELTNEIRSRNLPTKVILVASVYSKTAYKRQPTSLYGADDYVEQHHIPDKLPAKLARLVPTGGPLPRARSVHDFHTLSEAEQRQVAHIREAGERRLRFDSFDAYETGGGRRHATPEERARHLARLIVADVVLYNGDLVEAGIAAGDLAARLAADLQEGRTLFLTRVPAEVAAAHDFVTEALEEFIAARRTA